MYSKILSFLALLLFLVASTSAKTRCNGTELSVSNDLEIGLLTEKPCTHVYGDIVISNLNSAKRMTSFWTVEELHGSLIIENTTDLADSVNLQNLRVIEAGNQPAIILINNKGLKLAIGARLGFVSTNFRVVYWFIGNWPAFMTTSQHYTLFHASQTPRPLFYTDNHFITGPCNEWNYKLWSAVFGTLVFIMSIGLVGLSFYGRPSKQKTV